MTRCKNNTFPIDRALHMKYHIIIRGGVSKIKQDTDLVTNQEGRAVARKNTEENRENTFLVHVMYHENGTWQGEITWNEGHRKQRFRSELELMDLIQSVLTETAPDGGAEK